MVDYRENIICKLIMIVIVCIGIGICSSDTYAATDKTEQKAFFADGQTIKVYEMTVEEKNENPGMDLKVNVINDDGYDSYYITKDYTIYGGSESDFVDFTSITICSGEVKSVVLGGKNGGVGSNAELDVQGGIVREVKLCENAEITMPHIQINGEAQVDKIIVGCSEDEQGSLFSSLTLNSDSEKATNLVMGYSEGMLISDSISNTDGWIELWITGSNFVGAEQFEKLSHCVVNGIKQIKLHANGGSFGASDSMVYSAKLLDTEGNRIYEIDSSVLPIPERKGYVFKNWCIDENAIFGSDNIYCMTDDLYASWQKASNPMPLDLMIVLGESGDDITLDPLGGACTVEIPTVHDDVSIIGTSANGEKINVPVSIGENGVGYAKIDATSYDGSNTKTYVINVVETAEKNFSVKEQVIFQLQAWDGTIDEFEEPYVVDVSNDEAWSEDGAVIEVPYGTLKNGALRIIGDTWYEGVTINGQTQIDEELDLSSNSFEYVVKDSNSNEEKTYKFKIIESDGNSAELENMWLGFGDASEQFYHSERIDFSKLNTDEEIKVYVPYYFSEEWGISSFDIMPEKLYDNLNIEGLEDIFSYDGEDNKLISVKVTSANGKNTKTYKFRFIRDTLGSSTEFKSICLHTVKLSVNGHVNDELPVVEVDLNAAMTEEGAKVVVPENFNVKQGYYQLEGITKKGAGVRIAENEPYYTFVYWEPDVYVKPAEYNKTSDTLEFEVVSANGKETQKYKITVYQKGAIEEKKSVEDLNVNTIADIEYTGKALTPEIVIKDGDKVLKINEDFKVEYKNNTDVGKASVIITGIGEYTGTVTKYFNIVKADTGEDGIFGTNNILRVAGLNRYETSIDAAYTLKKSLGIDRFDNVIVATGDNYPDALTGCYLAKVKKAPILLVDDRTEAVIKEFIRGNLNKTGKVYLLGGPAVINSGFESSLKKSGYNVERLSGNDRYDTNLSILKEAGVNSEDLLVCTGNGYADSLSASAVGKPIILVDETLSKTQKNYLDGISTNKSAYLIGGPNVVKANFKKEFEKYAAKGITRLEGSDRYATSKAVADNFFRTSDYLTLAYGLNFPDGLSGGPLAMSIDAPLILVDEDTYQHAALYVKQAGVKKTAVLGGPDLIEDAIVKKIIQ